MKNPDGEEYRDLTEVQANYLEYSDLQITEYFTLLDQGKRLEALVLSRKLTEKQWRTVIELSDYKHMKRIKNERNGK